MFNNLDDLLKSITPDVYKRLQTAVEVGKWPNGTALSKEQRALCLQAIIAWDQQHLPVEERTAYVKPKPTACGSTQDAINDSQTLQFKGSQEP